MLERHSFSLIEPITLSLSKLPLLHRMASNDNGKCKMEEEAESTMAARKRLRHTNDDGSDDDSSDSLEEEPPQGESEEEETEEEVSSEVSSMNQLDTSEEKLHARHACGYLFSDDGDTPSTSPDTPPTSGSRWRSDKESSDDDFWV
jgi:Mg-chelatase subunit ChlI